MVEWLERDRFTPLPEAALFQEVSWSELEALDEKLAGTRARVTYLDGMLELATLLPAKVEEQRKTLALLLQAFLRHKQIRFYANKGSTTIGRKELGARKEPDESYCLGQRKAIPDFAIEVTVSSGGIKILEIYRRIGVQEVWFWEDGVIEIHALRSTGYELISQSELLPDLDICSLEFHSRMADQYDAVNDFLESLESS